MDLRLLLNPCDGHVDLDRRSSDLHQPEPRQASTVNFVADQTYKRLDNAHWHPYFRHLQLRNADPTCHVLFKHHTDARTAFLDVGFDANSIFNQICPLRKGRWRHEEEAYAIELVKMVHANRLPLKFRQSLRTFLAQKLHSDEMRVLKKVGNSDAFAFARQRGHVDQDAVVTGTAYENERSIEPLETLRRAFLKSVQIEVVVAMREYDKQGLLDSPTLGDF
ncbi:hypothetical protein SPRG_06269 [Saprolegnia parasitica CBS 223.65]|uniref:Uncharacterized protein n=1 Tax=Saprolegnia parasitica (strain CBS 223.65) TaxID=695850 RepID=A0A067CGE9_SAPPC|nr:hypothetical protein SPRG_06269 [Saprolegnia parasitica CBS 223.65]KDO28220.1 hypothetical protein SPRG_06269 [Saprolegnia parasitica CBS 223.65]|eukprot:XP_012201045.1 hypothetical protein SPRG_06269 [Saprolegnia parasitica CBS 223.65]